MTPFDKTAQPAPADRQDGTEMPFPVYRTDRTVHPFPVYRTDRTVHPFPVYRTDGTMLPFPVYRGDGTMLPFPVYRGDGTVLPFPVYRDTTEHNVVRKDGTGDTGCLLEMMKNSTILIGHPPPITPVTDLPEWQQDKSAKPTSSQAFQKHGGTVALNKHHGQKISHVNESSNVP